MTPPDRSASAAIWLWRVAVAVIILACWESYGRLVDSTWTSKPTDVAASLLGLFSGSLPTDIGVTLAEIGMGLLIGLPTGIAAGLILGRLPFTAALLRPMIVAANSVPMVALAPLLIMWYGLGMAPKVALVTVVVFFLIFFNTFAGVLAVDRDWVLALEVMGARPREMFQKVIAPACVAWILSGLKSALPYSLIAATVGEMMLARSGLGHLIVTSAAHYDIAGFYAALVVLMVLGGMMSELATGLEKRLLRGRKVVR